MEDLLDQLIEKVKNNLELLDQMIFGYFEPQRTSKQGNSLIESLPGDDISEKEKHLEAFYAALHGYERVLEYHARYIGLNLAHLVNQGISVRDLNHMSNDDLIDLKGAQELPQSRQSKKQLDLCAENFAATFSAEQHRLFLEYYEECFANIKKTCLIYVMLGYLMYNQIMVYGSPAFAIEKDFSLSLLERVCAGLKEGASVIAEENRA